VLAYGEHARLLGAGVCLRRCGYFTTLTDYVQATADTARHTVSSADDDAQLETGDSEVVDEPTASGTGQQRRSRSGWRAANRRPPRTGNWRSTHSGSVADVDDLQPDEREAVADRRRGAGAAVHRDWQYRGRSQRYRGQGRGAIFDTFSAGEVQPIRDDDDARRNAAERGQHRAGWCRGASQVDRGFSHQSLSSMHTAGVQQQAYSRGYRAPRGRGFMPSSSHGHAEDSANLRPTNLRSGGTRGRPRHSGFGRGRLGPASSFHRSTDSLVDFTTADSGTNTRVVDVPNEVGSEKCQLLIYHIGDLKQFGCRVLVDRKTHQVIVSGGGSADETAALDKTVELVYQKLVEMRQVKCSDISPRLAAVLSGHEGTKWTRELFKEHWKPATFYCDTCGMYVVAGDDAVAREAAALLSAQIGVLDVPLTETQMKFMQSQSWQSFVAGVEKNWIVAVETVQSPASVVRLVGVATDLSDAENVIRSQLAEKTVAVTELVMNPGEIRYIIAYCKDIR